MRFPVGPCLIGRGGAAPFAPCLSETSALDGVLRGRCDHGFLRDGDVGVLSEFLARLLFACVDRKGETGINAGAKDEEIFVDLVHLIDI